MSDLSEEIKLLKEKLDLLERIQKVQEDIGKYQPTREYVPYPVYPSWPTYPIYPTYAYREYWSTCNAK